MPPHLSYWVYRSTFSLLEMRLNIRWLSQLRTASQKWRSGAQKRQYLIYIYIYCKNLLYRPKYRKSVDLKCLFCLVLIPDLRPECNSFIIKFCGRCMTCSSSTTSDWTVELLQTVGGPEFLGSRHSLPHNSTGIHFNDIRRSSATKLMAIAWTWEIKSVADRRFR